jgi:biotin carboxylase
MEASSAGVGGVSAAAGPTALLLGGADVPDFQAALARRGRLGVMLSLPQALEVFERNDVIEFLGTVDFTRPLEVVRRIAALKREQGLDAVIPVVEYGLLPAALATSQLRLPGPSVAAVQNTRDKRRMRRVLAQAGLGQVRYALCAQIEEAQRFLDEVAGPVIVKPVSGSGSDGVSLVREAGELRQAFELASTALGFAGLLCEEYVEGPEVSLEAYSDRGRFVPVALTDKLTDERFLETGHQQPSAQPREVFEEVVSYAARALAALDVTHGVTHSEFRLSARGPVLIETHTRMGGGSIYVLTQLATGVSLPDLMVALALGERPDVEPRPRGRGAAIRFFTGRPGRVASIDVPPVAPGDGVHAAKVYVKPGHVVSGRSSSRDRLGHVIATGRDAADAGRAAEAFAARIRVAYEGE